MNIVNNILKKEEYVYKFINFMNNQIGGKTTFPINHDASNIDPSNKSNCGALALYGLSIFNKEQAQLINNRCKHNPKEYLPNGGLPFSILFDYIDKYSKYSKLRGILFIVRKIDSIDFDNYWNNYAKEILDKDGKNGIMLFCEFKNSTFNYGWGHFTILINKNDLPYVFDLQESQTPILFSEIFYFNNIKNFNFIEDVLDNTFQENISKVTSELYIPPPINIQRNISDGHRHELTLLEKSQEIVIKCEKSNIDITNYAYIWYNKDPNNLLTLTVQDKITIYNLINTYSYPNYLARHEVQNDMSAEDKKELLNNELLFIQKKFLEFNLGHIIVLQIPRILYDLFNLYYYYSNGFSLKYRYYCDDTSLQSKLNYNKYTLSLIKEIENNIFELNNIIISKISVYIINGIITKYDTILEYIIKDINSLSSNIITNEKKQVFHDVLNIEKQYSLGYTILYRGSQYEKDSTIFLTDEVESYIFLNSISLNMSILSGFIGDYDACTLNYITPGTINFKKDNNRIKYNIKKFHLDDLSDEFSLFFIPPIHPFLQLYCVGELWHPRTKIGKNLFNYENIRVRGLNCDRYKFIQKCDYLISNKTFQEIEELYQKYKSTKQINQFGGQEVNELLDKLKEEEYIEKEEIKKNGGIFNKTSLYKLKYLKYKIKYLKLKNIN
jgi:hypothetical protein